MKVHRTSLFWQVFDNRNERAVIEITAANGIKPGQLTPHGIFLKKQGDVKKSINWIGTMNPLNPFSENKGEEKRQYRRLNKHLEVRYYISANSDPVKVYTEDISVGGIRVKNSFPINEHYQFPMRITLNSESDVVIKAIVKVAWQRSSNGEWTIGLEFIHMDEEDRKAIQNFIESERDD